MNAPDVTHSARRWWALMAMAASVVVVGLDLTVLNLALPTLSVRLHANTGDLQWIADSYSLVLAALMLPAGLLGDRYGRKRILLIALALFGVSSLACAYSTSVGMLIGARAVLGIGAAAIFPLALSVLPVLFAPEERQRAVATMASASMLSFPIGPIVGGYLLDHFWWGSVFLINVPVVAIAVIAVALLLPESKSANRPTIDLAGLAVSSAGLVALTYGFIKAGQDGWTDAAALGLIGAGVVILAALPSVEHRVAASGRQPLVDLGLFRSAAFRWGTILATLVSFAMFGLFFALPQYFQDVRGTDAMGSGLRLLPMVGGMLVGMIAGTRLLTPRTARTAADKPADGDIASAGTAAGGTAPARAAAFGPRTVVTAGYVIMAAAMAMGAFTRLDSSTGYTVAWVALAGLGLGLVMPPAMTVALGALSAERSGAGSALLSALRQVGSTIGVAVLGTLISTAYSSRLTPSLAGLPSAVATAAKSSVGGGVAVAEKIGSSVLLDGVRASFVHGMDIMLWTCGGIAVAGALLAVAFLPRRPAAAAAATTVPASETSLSSAEVPLMPLVGEESQG